MTSRGSVQSPPVGRGFPCEPSKAYAIALLRAEGRPRPGTGVHTTVTSPRDAGYEAFTIGGATPLALISP